jgi:molybdopterin synthase catalytic subunit
MSGQEIEKVRVQEEDFDVGAELERVKSSSRMIGGVTAFLGVVRDFSRGEGVEKLFFEFYPGMAEKKLGELRQEALEKFELTDMFIAHRHGELHPGENIVLIIAAAEHREGTFKAAAWCIAELKERVPIWKKEFTTSGEVWVDEGAGQ